MTKQDNRVTIAEQNLIRYLIADSERVHLISESDFITTTGKAFHRAILSLNERDEDVTVDSLTYTLNETSDVSKARVEAVFHEDISIESFDVLSRRLKRESRLHKIKTEMLPDLVDSVSDIDGVTSESTLVLIEDFRRSMELLQENKTIVFNAKTIIDEYENRLYERERGQAFYSSGCMFLDRKLTDGFAPQRISTIFGTSGVGKSTYALYLVNRQINKNIPSMYVSLEMDLISSMDRLIAQRNNLSIEELHPSTNWSGEDSSAQIQDHVFDIITKEKKKLGENKLFRFIEQPGLSLSEIEYYCNYFMRETKQKYMILTIDLMSMVKDFNRTDNKAQSYEDAMNELHSMVKRLGIHCVGVFQSRRPSQRVNVETLDDLIKFKPRIEEIKNSAAVEERSRIIISTFREKHFAQRLFPDDPQVEVMQDIMEVDILKNNVGALSTLKYLFIPTMSKLTKIDEEIPEVS